MPSYPGTISDRGSRGIEYNNKRISLKGSSWFEPQGSVSMFEDFIASPNTILTEHPSVLITQSGTALTAGIISATGGGTASVGHAGWVSGKTDDVDAEIDEIGLGGAAATGWMLPSRAGNGVVVGEIGFVIPTALTSRQYFVGLTDDPIEGTGTNGSINNTTAYTTVAIAEDAAGFVFSSLGTAPTVWKYSSVIATVNDPVSADKHAGTAVVDAYTVCRVEVDSLGNAYFYQSTSGSTAIGRSDPTFVGSTALAVTPTVLLLPFMSAAPTTTTGVEWEIDYMFGACAR